MGLFAFPSLKTPEFFTDYALIFMLFLNSMFTNTVGNKNVDFISACDTGLAFCGGLFLFGSAHSFTNIFAHHCSKKTTASPLAFWVVGQSFSSAFYTPGKPPTFPALIKRFIPSCPSLHRSKFMYPVPM